MSNDSREEHSKTVSPLKVRLDWRIGEEHLPLLFLKYLLELDGYIAVEPEDENYKEELKKLKSDHKLAQSLGLYSLMDFKIELTEGTGSQDGLKAVEHGQCHIALSGATTFLQSCIKNKNILTVGRYITRPPITILVDMDVVAGTKVEPILRDTEIVSDSKEVLWDIFNDQKIGVFSGSVAMDWFRYFAQYREIKPRSIVRMGDANEFGTYMSRNIPFLVCYEYNQAVEVLSRKQTKKRFLKILLRNDPPSEVKNKCRVVKLTSAEDIKYYMMPGVVFAVNCMVVFGKNTTSKDLRSKLGCFFCALQKVSGKITEMNPTDLYFLARRVSKYLKKGQERLYLPAPGLAAANHIIWERLILLAKVYWDKSIKWQQDDDCDPREVWLQLAEMCDIPQDQIGPADEPGTGVWHDIEIPEGAC